MSSSSRTIAEPISLGGVTLFTAQPARCDIRPGNAGIRFTRVDDPTRPSVSATINHVRPRALHPAFETISARYTTIATDATSISTVEHLLAALAGFGITDADIELDADEPPIFDGSAVSWTQMLAAAGTKELGTVDPIVVREAIDVGGIRIEPREEPGTAYRYELDYGTHPALGQQTAEIVLDGSTNAVRAFASEIAPARTFGLAQDVEAMRGLGLFGHLSAEQMLVLGPFGPIDNAFRYDNEPARHKLLDLIGDLSLVGRPIQASITGRKTGHADNHAAARTIAQL